MKWSLNNINSFLVASWVKQTISLFLTIRIIFAQMQLPSLTNIKIFVSHSISMHKSHEKLTYYLIDVMQIMCNI